MKPVHRQWLLLLSPDPQDLQDPRQRANLYELHTPCPMARKKQAAETVLDPIAPSDNTEMPTETVTAPEVDSAKVVRIRGEKKVGQELLDFVKANEGMPVEDLAFNAGYYTKTTNVETGETNTTPHKTEFFKAVTEASTGIGFTSTKRTYSTRKGRAPIITVGKLGNCVVGARHSAVAGFEAGSKVLVTSEAGKITLTAYEGAEPAEDEQGDDLDI